MQSMQQIAFPKIPCTANQRSAPLTAPFDGAFPSSLGATVPNYRNCAAAGRWRSAVHCGFATPHGLQIPGTAGGAWSGVIALPSRAHPLVIAPARRIHRACRRLVAPFQGEANSFAGAGSKALRRIPFSNR